MVDRMPSAAEPCPICAAPAQLVREVRDVVIKNRSARVLEEFWRCDECDEEYMTPEQMRAAQDRAVRAIREAEGLLQADEIRALRESYGLSQRAFEQLLGVGPKTVVRWENGTVFQSRAVDTLLRVLRHAPDALRALAGERGVELEPGRYWASGTEATGITDEWQKLPRFWDEGDPYFKPLKDFETEENHSGANLAGAV